jgi:hypothetical protein
MHHILLPTFVVVIVAKFLHWIAKKESGRTELTVSLTTRKGRQRKLRRLKFTAQVGNENDPESP